jgi:hypothetical protein
VNSGFPEGNSNVLSLMSCLSERVNTYFPSASSKVGLKLEIY